MATTAQRLAALEAEVTELRELVAMREAIFQVVHNMAYEEGRESVLGRQAAAAPPRLHIAEEGAR